MNESIEMLQNELYKLAKEVNDIRDKLKRENGA